MTQRDDGGPAFPVSTKGYPEGMTLRDYFAAKAMQAEIITTWSDATPEAATAFVEAAAKADRTPEDHLAFNAYAIADAMLKERQK